MPLSGLNRTSVRPRGGVAKVEIVPASLWAERTPADISAWAFREDRARYYEEKTGAGALSRLVRHTLAMEFPATAQSRRAVDELARVCAVEGVVAILTMASGEVIVAGYSARFGVGYPLRVVGMEVSSGFTPAEIPTLALTLESIDADYSEGLS